MSSGKTIRLFLVDGTPKGVLTAEIMNWTGKVLVAPRSQLDELSKRPEAGRTGVYLLVGQDLDDPQRDRVYVGEADNVLKRLASHNHDEAKDFWLRTALIVSKDENLTKSHARYLESRLIQMGNEADRAAFSNGTAPPRPPLPEPEQADMEDFLQQILMILPVLGFNFFQAQPNVSTHETAPGQSPLFELNQVGVTAKAREVDGEFVVMAGSTARREATPSWTSYKELRSRLVKDNVLVPDENEKHYRFARNYAFTSPSAAAAVVMARNTNGRTSWKLKDTDQTYAQWDEARIQVSPDNSQDEET